MRCRAWSANSLPIRSSSSTRIGLQPCRRCAVLDASARARAVATSLATASHLPPRAAEQALGSMAALRELNARQNVLASLPESVARLTNLEGLFLDRNRLSALPDLSGCEPAFVHWTAQRCLILDMATRAREPPLRARSYAYADGQREVSATRRDGGGAARVRTMAGQFRRGGQGDGVRSIARFLKTPRCLTLRSVAP